MDIKGTAEIGDKVSAAAARGYYYLLRLNRFAVCVEKLIAAVGLLYPLAVIEGEHIRADLCKRADKILHCKVVFIRTQMLNIHIKQAQIVLNTLKL